MIQITDSAIRVLEAYNQCGNLMDPLLLTTCPDHCKSPIYSTIGQTCHGFVTFSIKRCIVL